MQSLEVLAPILVASGAAPQPPSPRARPDRTFTGVMRRALAPAGASIAPDVTGAERDPIPPTPLRCDSRNRLGVLGLCRRIRLALTAHKPACRHDLAHQTPFASGLMLTISLSDGSYPLPTHPRALELPPQPREDSPPPRHQVLPVDIRHPPKLEVDGDRRDPEILRPQTRPPVALGRRPLLVAQVPNLRRPRRCRS